VTRGDQVEDHRSSTVVFDGRTYQVTCSCGWHAAEFESPRAVTSAWNAHARGTGSPQDP